MQNDDAKIQKELQRLAAAFFAIESNRDALISVTRVEVGKNWKTATVFLSVMPESKEKAAYDFAMRMRADLRTYLKEHMRSRALPFISIEIDAGEKHRQKIDQLSKEAGL